MIPRSATCALGTLLLTILLSPTPSLAQGSSPVASGPLTLDEAVAASLQHFPSVRSARADTVGAEAGVARETSRWIPDLTLRGSGTQYQKPGLVYPIHSFRPEDIPPFNRTLFQGGIYLDYTLFDGGGRTSRIREARDLMEASRASLDGSTSELIAQVAATYLQTLSRRAALQAHDERLDALRAERERVATFEKAGKAARIEMLRVEATLAGAESERVHLAAQLAASERDLTGLTGMPLERTRAENLASISLIDTLLAPDDTLVALAFTRNAEVREAEWSVSAARASAGVARAARLPRLGLTGAYQAWTDPDGNSSLEWNVGVHLEQTLFTGGDVTARIHEADARDRTAQEGLRLARIQTRRTVLNAVDAVREADASVRSLESAVARYEEVARIEALALDAGTGVQTDFLNAEADLLASRADLAEARRNAVVTRVELARLTGALDTEWLSQNLESAR